MKIALFDLDGTLLEGDTDVLWGELLTREDAFDHETTASFQEGYAAGDLNADDFVERFLSPLKLYGHEACVAWRSTLLAEHILPALRRSALDRLEWHRERADELVLATATNEFLTEPVASHLGIPHLIASPAARRGSEFTGERAGPACFREEKLRYVESWLGARGHTLKSAETWFYSDSINDLPLLDAVHHPVVVAPDERLGELATAKGWELIPS